MKELKAIWKEKLKDEIDVNGVENKENRETRISAAPTLPTSVKPTVLYSKFALIRPFSHRKSSREDD